MWHHQSCATRVDVVPFLDLVLRPSFNMKSDSVVNGHILVPTRLLEQTHTLVSDAGDAQIELASFHTSTPSN
jgi:hypothetical protein